MFVVWTDTAPRHIEFTAPVNAREPVELVLYNVWRDEKYGTMMYGLNAAGTVIEQPRLTNGFSPAATVGVKSLTSETCCPPCS
jgi:hypothetical protein